MANGLEQKLIQQLERVLSKALSEALTPISAGVDIPYEFGRRVGAKQGMELMIQNTIKFFTDEGKDDSKL